MHELFQHAFDIEVVWVYKWYLNWAKSLSAARCEIAEEQIWDMAILAIDILSRNLMLCKCNVWAWNVMQSEM